MSKLIFENVGQYKQDGYIHKFWVDTTETWQIEKDADWGYRVSKMNPQQDAFETIDFKHHSTLKEAKDFCKNYF